jgi:CTP:molybdopterin cytidylyltransferase MocA
LTERVAAAVLAAGRGVRYGGTVPKPLLELGGRPLLAHALDAANASGLRPVLCVVSDARVAEAVPSGVEVLYNDAPEDGIASSLQVALRVLTTRDEIGALVVGLADQPLVGPDAYRRVAATHDEGAVLAVATYGGVRGNPVLLSRTLWAEALDLVGDEGARVLMRRHGAREVPCDGTGVPTDVDTPADMAAMEKTWRSQTAFE